MNLDEKILGLKTEGRSLREIGRALGISQVAVFKRLKRLNGEEKVLTKTENARLTASSRKNDKVLTSSKPRKSRVSGQSEATVNQVVTKKTPSLETNGSVTPSQDAVEGRLEGVQGAFEGVCEDNSGVDDLLLFIRATLEAKGIEFYRMETEQEAYQVEDKGQTLRIYVKRKVEKG